jgi:hypothetical protein
LHNPTKEDDYYDDDDDDNNNNNNNNKVKISLLQAMEAHWVARG